VSYRRTLSNRDDHEAQELTALTGWNINDIGARMQIMPTKWWQRIWWGVMAIPRLTHPSPRSWAS
jgi:hypothetical protein